MTPIAFVDTETTGLDPRRHDAWEIAVIRRVPGHDLEHLWQIRVPTFDADPKALEVSRYKERFAVPTGELAVALPTDTSGETRPIGSAAALFDEIYSAVDGAVLIGSNPAFDAGFLTKALWLPSPAPWHYRTVCVAVLAAGYVHGRYGKALEDGELEAVTHPWKSHQLSRAVGVEPPGADVAHTALGDARWARDVYDAVTGGAM